MDESPGTSLWTLGLHPDPFLQYCRPSISARKAAQQQSRPGREACSAAAGDASNYVILSEAEAARRRGGGGSFPDRKMF